MTTILRKGPISSKATPSAVIPLTNIRVIKGTDMSSGVVSAVGCWPWQDRKQRKCNSRESKLTLCNKDACRDSDFMDEGWTGLVERRETKSVREQSALSAKG